jgi:TetR/AcrR family transcriptional regulator, transcriptional repressor for nem operon
VSTLLAMIGEEAVEAERTTLTQKGRATRARIVDSAAALFFERGVAGTSLDDVGAAAGVGKSQLYHYFTDKAGLVRAVIDRQADRIVTAQELSKLDSWDAWQRWRDQVVELQLRRQCKGGCPIGSLASELADADEKARSALVTGFDRWQAVFHAGLTAMQGKGLLRPDADPEALALAMLASLQGGLLLCQARKDIRPLEAALDTALTNLHSLAHAPAS